ncbi:MAG: hypothetical protein GY835_25005, partial [bacterium]|nr:hypothetical protein [bacterium]
FRLAALLDFRERKLTERGLPREHFQRLAKWVALSLRYPLVARRVKKDIAVLERLETAASDDKAWKQLAKESEWKDLLEPAVRDLLKADVQLHGNPIEFAILV